MSTLDGMTHARWTAMTPAQREALRTEPSGDARLLPLIGWRVEVVTDYGETRRFIVGKSTGWRPCMLEVKTRRSMGGTAAEIQYASVRALYKVREVQS